MTTLRGRARGFAASLLIGAGLLIHAVPVASAAEIFYRFEHEAVANWTIVETCTDGTTATTRVQVIGGTEFESPDLDDVNEFVTVRVQGFTCDGGFINDRGSGPAEFSGTRSLNRASVAGTIVLQSGATASVDVTWDATGPLETTVNQTHFTGFTGIFRGQERDAVATGSVVIDGVELVDGSTTNASIETLEDRNISTSG